MKLGKIILFWWLAWWLNASAWAAETNGTISLEAGSGFAFVYPHPQLKLGYRLADSLPDLELSALYAAGINNFQALSHTGGLSLKYHFLRTGYLQPFVQVGGMLSYSAEDPGRTLAGGLLGVGLDGEIWQGWGYNLGIQLIAPDIYSRSPFVFRPELNLRYQFAL